MSDNVFAISGFYQDADKSATVSPDPYLGGRPADNFVMCRNNDGLPTATYGDAVWDFSPYALEEA